MPPPKITAAGAASLKKLADAELTKPNGRVPSAQILEQHRAYLIEAAREHMKARREDVELLAAKAPGGGLKLEDIVDFLRSPAGAQARKALEAQLGPTDTSAAFSNLLRVDDEPPKALWSTPARDDFEAAAREVIESASIGHSLDQTGMVKAVTAAFAKYTGSDGRIDAAALHQQAPATGGKLYDYLVDVTKGEPVPNQAPGTKLEGLSDSTVARVGAGVDVAPIVARMPGFARVAAQLTGGGKPFEGVKVVAIQHLLPTLGGVLDQLEQAGVKREDMRLIGKSYSTVDEMYAHLVGKGYSVDPGSIGGSAGSVEEHLVNVSRDTLTELFEGIDPKTSKQRFVLADDGGKLLYALNKYFPEYAHLCTGFEQTARGIQVLEQMQRDGVELKCPVVNMARSQLKADTEIPLIGENVVFDALNYLDALKLPHPKQATVLGYGPVGQETAAALLRRGIEVAIFDPDPERQKLAREHGCRALGRDEAIGFGELVIGATGRGAMSLDDYPKLRDGAVLVNGASGNHEMGANAFGTKGRWFREMAYEPEQMMVRDGSVSALFQGKRVNLGQGDLGAASMHRVVKDHETGKEALVLRSGHVVNLGRDLPPEWIQVTRALVFASCLQSLGEKTPGIVDLKQSTQDAIRSAVNEDLARQGLSMATPDFRAVPGWDL
ncbi:MAG: hypothetical protein JNK82_35285 [Myxococcaceae bacterium]|nr:hypothetical protein [Myxococcaceae bacterium]